MYIFNLFLIICQLYIINSYPQIDASWDNTDCSGCICTPTTMEQCACLEYCPNITDYFYILNLDPLDSINGSISHSVNITQNMFMEVYYTFPVYNNAKYHICIMDRCIEPIIKRSSMILIVQPTDTEISFRYHIKPSRFSVWQITNITWTPM